MSDFTTINSSDLFEPDSRTAINGNFAKSHGFSGWIPITTSGGTINATLTYSSVDDPTAVVSTSVDLTSYIGIGTRLKLTNGGNTIYGIVTAITSSTMTYLSEISPTSASAGGGTTALHILANSAITNVFFSSVKIPLGFPADARKWTMALEDQSSRTQASPNNGTYYNLGSLSLAVPIGAWDISWASNVGSSGTTTSSDIRASLSTSSSTISDLDLAIQAFSGSGTNVSFYIPVHRKKNISLAAKTTYYAIARAAVTAGTLEFAGNVGSTTIRALSSYL